MIAAVRAEWTKLRTLPSAAWLLVGATGAAIAVSAIVAAAWHPNRGSTVDPTKLSLIGVDLGQAVIATFAVLAISEEYGTGMIRVSLANVPGRLTLLTAKAVNLAGLTLPVGLVSVFGCLFAGRLLLPGAGVNPAHGYALGLLYLPPLAAQLVHDPAWRRHIEQLAPMTAGLAIQATANLHSLPIGPWAGLGVLGAWAAASLLLAVLVLELRDA